MDSSSAELLLQVLLHALVDERYSVRESEKPGTFGGGGTRLQIEGVHRLLLGQRQAGTAVLLISEELEELLSLSDRVAVIYEGRIVGEVEGEERETVGLMMTGHWQGAARPERNAST